MSPLEELIRQKAELDQAIGRARADTRSRVLAEIHAIMSTSGLTLADLASPRAAPKAPVSRKGTADLSGRTMMAEAPAGCDD
jgi:hypothetical protein